jgi:gentisate 1,2-dioxygenase
MEEGDFLTTPHWTWHDHYNGSKEPVYWLDGLDVRLTGIGARMYEDYPQEQQQVEHPKNYSARLFGHARPTWLKSDFPTPPFLYTWQDTSATLEALKGSGATVVDSQTLEWNQGDIFVVPAWHWHRYENRGEGDSILFSMTDAPTFMALGLYREEGAGE